MELEVQERINSVKDGRLQRFSALQLTPFPSSIMQLYNKNIMSSEPQRYRTEEQGPEQVLPAAAPQEETFRSEASDTPGGRRKPETRVTSDFIHTFSHT